jgi:hypothetical protein
MWATGVERAIAPGAANVAVAMSAVAIEATAHQVNDQARADARHRVVSKMNTIPVSVHPSVPISAPDANRRNVQRGRKNNLHDRSGDKLPLPAATQTENRLAHATFVQTIFGSR